jgi:hypothetical protein
MTQPADPTVAIEIRGLPVALHERAQAHSDELLREFRLIAVQARLEGEGSVPHRLLQLVTDLTATYSGLTEQQEDALAAAMACRHETIDLHYDLPTHVADACRALNALLDEADEYCRAGQHLLTLATPPDCVAYRRWFLDEFIRQAAGEAPTPWAGSPQVRLYSDAASDTPGSP